VVLSETNDAITIHDIGFLSEIEAGQKRGTPATLKKIADALRIKVDDLI
jgi:transcriptional regulator with XRE-family HTH domain